MMTEQHKHWVYSIVRELKASVRVECSMSFNPEGCVDRGVKNGAIPADPSQIEEVIVYCRSGLKINGHEYTSGLNFTLNAGRRAKRFADVLKKRGFKNIITGSIDELKEKIGVVSVN